jgi:hypothetical protein
MRKSIGFALVVALVVSTVPALAGESFHALSRLPAIEQAALTPLPDAQLATIEGTSGDKNRKDNNDVEVCIVCLNIAEVDQVNVAAGSLFTEQVNVAVVDQDINR